MEKLARSFGRLAAGIGMVCLLILALAILADAIMRGAFNAPIYGLSDLAELVTPVIVASCFPLALLNRQNITIRFLGRALPARAGQGVELFGQIVALIIFAALAVELGRYTAGIIRYSQYTWLLHLPVWPSWCLATAIMGLCVPVQAMVIRTTLADLRGGKALASNDSEIEHDIETVI